MTAIAVEHEEHPTQPVDAVATRHARIPMTRVVAVELRKMFDTRSGFWLMASIVITATLATTAVMRVNGMGLTLTRGARTWTAATAVMPGLLLVGWPR